MAPIMPAIVRFEQRCVERQISPIIFDNVTPGRSLRIDRAHVSISLPRLKSILRGLSLAYDVLSGWWPAESILHET